MKFTIKKSLIGMAALSLLAPVASHADTAKGQYLNDGLGRSTKDGRGSTCVSSGGPDHAFEAAECASASQEASAAAAAENAARKAAAAEAAAASQAAREEALLAVEPGSGLKSGERGAYVTHGDSAPIRDGFGRSCVKDGRWTPALATQECDPDLYNLYQARKGQPAATQTAQPESELAPRLPYVAEEAIVIAPFVAPLGADDEDPVEETVAEEFVEDEEVTPEMMLSEEDRTLPDEGAEAVALAAVAGAVAGDDEDEDEVEEEALEEAYEDEEVTPDMMLAESDRTLPGEDGEVVMLAAVARDDDDEEEAEEEALEEVYEDEDVTPDMMLSDADRTLDEDADIGLLAAVAVADEDDEDEGEGGDEGVPYDDEDEETTPDMMLSEADRTLEEEEKSPGMATLTDTSPGVVPPPETKVEDKPIIDNRVPDFPVTKYEYAQAATEQPKALPVTINVQEDGLFDFDRADLRSAVIAKLDGVAAMLRDARVDSITIVGHADPIGSADYNQALSERRAEAAKRYLVGKGIDANRISTSGAGENDLVVTREDCAGKRKQALIECLQPNRRVVVDAAGTRSAK